MMYWHFLRAKGVKKHEELMEEKKAREILERKIYTTNYRAGVDHLFLLTTQEKDKIQGSEYLSKILEDGGKEDYCWNYHGIKHALSGLHREEFFRNPRIEQLPKNVYLTGNLAVRQRCGDVSTLTSYINFGEEDLVSILKEYGMPEENIHMIPEEFWHEF